VGTGDLGRRRQAEVGTPPTTYDEGLPASRREEEEAAMGLMDKVKAQTGAGLAKAGEAAKAGQAKAGEAAKAGQAKLDAVQAKRNADGLLRRLGAAAFAEHEGRADDVSRAEVEHVVEELRRYETDYGPIAP